MLQQTKQVRNSIFIFAIAISGSVRFASADGLYKITDGSFRTLGGFAGILDFDVPNSRHSYIELTTDSSTNSAQMRLLDELYNPIELLGSGSVYYGIFDENRYTFFDDSITADLGFGTEVPATMDYTLELIGDAGILVNGHLASDESVCCDMVTSIAHENVTATLLDFVTGDFNQNGQLDLPDIDRLIQEINSDKPSPAYDLNDDETVNTADLTIWVKDLKKTWIGDGNLDSEFNSMDFVKVFQADEYNDGIPNNSAWAEGDWDGDGDFTSKDLLAAFVDGGFDQGRRDSIMKRVEPVVPEPSSFAMIAFAVAANIGLCRSRLRLRSRN